MIGIFDSGFGGLTTLRELRRLVPEYDILFLGDNARTPYGNRSEAVISHFSEEGVNFLFSRGATIVLVACNTASSDALRFLQGKYPERKILGALVPAVETALQETRFGRIGIVGTRATIVAGNYTREIQKRAPFLYHNKDKRAESVPRIFSAACPLLVPLIEEGWGHKPETRMILKKYLMPLKHAHIDTLILACTHYPILESEFAKRMGSQVILVNSGRTQAEKTIEYFEHHPEIASRLSQGGKTHFFTTDDVDRFRAFGEKILGQSLGKNAVEKVEISL